MGGKSSLIGGDVRPVLAPLLTLKPESASGVAHARSILPALDRTLGPGGLVVLATPHGRDLLRDSGLPLARVVVHDPGRSRLARLADTRRLVPRLVEELRARAVYVADGQLLPAPGLPPTVIALHFHLNFSAPRGQPWRQRLYWKLWYDRAMRRSCAQAAALAAPSAAFAREMEALVPESRGRLHVVPHGVGSEFRPDDLPPAAPPRVLVVGNPAPYKNVDGAIAAFAAAAADLPHELVLAGLSAGDVADRADRLGVTIAVRGRLRAVGHVPHAELPALYRSSSALLFPSRVESFGLPVLEAMACGLPVVASDLPSLLELSGGAALHVPPDDRAGLASALRRVLTDGAVASDLSRRGLARAALFTWDEAARRTAALLA